MATLLPIEIVGGGVAGLSLGLALRRAGVPVTLFEASDYPRHRVCGEFMAGLAEPTVDRLGLRECLAGAYPNRTVRYHWRDQALPLYSLPEMAWGISRHVFDARLAAAFAAAGGDLRPGTRAPEDETGPGRVWAIGRHRQGPHWVGLKLHARKLEMTADLEVHLGDRAYLGISRIENGAVNVCGLFGPRSPGPRGPALIFDYFAAAGLQGPLARLRRAEIDPDSCCVSAASLGDPRCAAPDRIRIGDACASIPAYTGNGLAMALQGAALALPVLKSYAQGSLSWFEATRQVAQSQNRAFRRRLFLASHLHPFFISPLPQSLFATAVRTRLLPIRLLYRLVH